MQTVYKLTDGNNKTRGGMTWGENITHSATGSGGLCTSGCIHSYASPELAVLMAPIHVSYENMKLWEAKQEVLFNDGTKQGGRSLTTIRQVSLPVVTDRQRVIFAILCAQKVMKTTKVSVPAWDKWAEDFLAGRNDRFAADAAAAAYAYADAAAADAAYAVHASADAADAAAAANAAAYAAAYAADAAAYAADAALNAARNAAYAVHAADFITEMAKKALAL